MTSDPWALVLTCRCDLDLSATVEWMIWGTNNYCYFYDWTGEEGNDCCWSPSPRPWVLASITEPPVLAI